MSKTLTPIMFPGKGIQVGQPYSMTPEGVALDALNVRPHDSMERRRRGGKRTGISKYFDVAPDSGNFVQSLGDAVEAVPLSEDAGIGDKLAGPSADVAATAGDLAIHPTGQWVAWVSNTLSTTNIRVAQFSTETGVGDNITIPVYTSHANCQWSSVAWSPDGLFLAVAGNSNVSSSTTAARNRLQVAPFDPDTETFGTVIRPISGEGVPGTVVSMAWHPSGEGVVVAAQSGNGTHYYPFDGSALDTPLSAPDSSSSPLRAAFTPDGNAFLTADPTASATLYAWPFDLDTGFGARFAQPAVAPSRGASSLAVSHDGAHVFLLIAKVEFGDDPHAKVAVYAFNSATGWGTQEVEGFEVSGSGSNTSGTIDAHPSEDYILVALNQTPRIAAYFFTGSGFLTALEPDSGISAGSSSARFSPLGDALAARTTELEPEYLVPWVFSPETLNPSARRTRIIGVAGGSVYRSNFPPTALNPVSGGSDVLNPSIPLMQSFAFQKVFFLDGSTPGYVYYDLATNTVKDWATDVTAGDLPIGGDSDELACRIIALYRGRIVMAGLLSEPQNWFMSKSGDPFDWDYSPETTTAIQAVAGNSSVVGELGDVVTALMPYQDDLMFMGSPNSLWVMRGDPAAGGAIDNISRQIGVVGAQAFTWDSSHLYFLSRNGLYRTEANGGAPEHISQGRLDSVFDNIDFSTNHVRLLYDADWQGVHIFITPSEQPASSNDHWFWDSRTDSFWRDQYPAVQGPTAVSLFNADNPADRAVLLGGWDGYVRSFDEDANGDDGTAITSMVLVQPMNAGQAFMDSLLDDINLILGEGSEAVTLKLYGGNTVEQAKGNQEAGNALFSKVIVPGRNSAIRQRVRSNAIILEISQTSSTGTWAFESGVLKTKLLGRVRGRR